MEEVTSPPGWFKLVVELFYEYKAAFDGDRKEMPIDQASIDQQYLTDHKGKYFFPAEFLKNSVQQLKDDILFRQQLKMSLVKYDEPLTAEEEAVFSDE